MRKTEQQQKLKKGEAMGKHDKKEEVLTASVPSDDYYKARIQQLESDIRSLHREVQALEDKEIKLQDVINELHEAINSLLAENSKLKDEIIRRVVGA